MLAVRFDPVETESMQKRRKTLVGNVNSGSVNARSSDPHLHDTQDDHRQGKPHHTHEHDGDNAKNAFHS